MSGFGGSSGSGSVGPINTVQAPLYLVAANLYLKYNFSLGFSPGNGLFVQCAKAGGIPGVVQIGTQAQVYVGSPYGAGCPIVPSITNLLVRRQAVQGAPYLQALGSAPNARGTHAIDFQSYRKAITQVASGAAANCFGSTCTASGNYSSAMGYLNTVSGKAGSAFGYTNTVSFQYGNAVGRNNTARIATRAQAFGDGNNVAGATASGFGVLNLVGAVAFTAAKSSAFGYGNSIGQAANSDKASACGYKNTCSGAYTSCFGSKNTASNSEAFAAGYACAASGLRAMAIGYLAQATQADTLAVGRSTQATGFNGQAFGFNCVASGQYGLAIGYKALQRVFKTTVLQPPIIAPKTGVVVQANAFAQLSGVQNVLWTIEIDFTAAGATYTFTLPAGARFFIDEVGVIVEELDGSVTTQPTYSFGITGTNAKYLAATLGTNLGTLLQRDVYNILLADVGEASLTFTITVPGVKNTATVYKGKAYFKGMLIELEP